MSVQVSDIIQQKRWRKSQIKADTFYFEMDETEENKLRMKFQNDWVVYLVMEKDQSNRNYHICLQKRLNI